jgi:NAD(P)-dependent dehydrogenase (short-subunit alcohol dehydrogenase family)
VTAISATKYLLGQSAYVSTKFAVEGLSESMVYELEPFGIRVVLVEPGPIRTNFADGMVAAKKSQDANSPYAEIMKKLNARLASIREYASSPDLVAKVVLKAVTSENPSLRYLAGKDIETWMEAKRSMSDEDFRKTIKQNFMR